MGDGKCTKGVLALQELLPLKEDAVHGGYHLACSLPVTPCPSSGACLMRAPNAHA